MGVHKLSQTGFRLSEDILNKMKYIAWNENESLNLKAAESFADTINRWERKNGAITDEMLKKVIKK